MLKKVYLHLGDPKIDFIIYEDLGIMVINLDYVLISRINPLPA